MLLERVLTQFGANTWILEGPSTPFAEVRRWEHRRFDWDSWTSRIVRAEDLILGVQVVVDPAKNGSVRTE